MALIAGIIAGAAGAPGEETRIGDLLVANPWARASAGLATTGVVYLTIENRGTAADRLVEVSTPVAERAKVHTTAEEGGVMTMRPVEAVEIAAGQAVAFAPGGLHIMLLGLEAPLKQGERFPLTLAFEKAGRLRVEVSVEGVGAMNPSAEHRTHDQMDGQ